MMITPVPTMEKVLPEDLQYRYHYVTFLRIYCTWMNLLKAIGDYEPSKSKEQRFRDAFFQLREELARTPTGQELEKYFNWPYLMKGQRYRDLITSLTGVDIHRECLYCESKFTPKNICRQYLFCSKKCRLKMYYSRPEVRERIWKNHIKNYRKKHPEFRQIVCNFCKEKKIVLSAFLHSGSRTCSVDCRHAYRKEYDRLHAKVRQLNGDFNKYHKHVVQQEKICANSNCKIRFMPTSKRMNFCCKKCYLRVWYLNGRKRPDPICPS